MNWERRFGRFEVQIWTTENPAKSLMYEFITNKALCWWVMVLGKGIALRRRGVK